LILHRNGLSWLKLLRLPELPLLKVYCWLGRLLEKRRDNTVAPGGSNLLEILLRLYTKLVNRKLLTRRPKPSLLLRKLLLLMGKVSRIDKRIKALTVSTGRDTVGRWDLKLLLSLLDLL